MQEFNTHRAAMEHRYFFIFLVSLNQFVSSGWETELHCTYYSEKKVHWMEGNFIYFWYIALQNRIYGD